MRLRELCITSESDNDEVFGAPIWAKRTAHLSGQIVLTPSGFEAVRPSFCDLVSEHVDGSKTSYQRAKRGYAKLSPHLFYVAGLLFASNRRL